MTVICPKHSRWIFIDRADATASRRDCPECPPRHGAPIIMYIACAPDDMTLGGGIWFGAEADYDAATRRVG